ncbi:MAG: YqaE/Pmp3 family membrane protein [Ferruginibacter sp.]|nr:YqaE/Pmp3 family membrane protein [Cytophagales bacterium]
MKASLQKARDIVKTNQADRTAGKELTRAARKQERTALRSVFKEARADADDDKVLEVILAIFIPPLGVYLHEDEINSKFWIDLVLTLLFFIPGVVYALLVVTDSI